MRTIVINNPGPQGSTGPQGIPGVIPNTSSFATTGSNVFIGNQILTGSLFATGSNTLIGNTALTGSLNITGSTTQTGNNTLIGNTVLSGSIEISGSQLFNGTQTLSGSFLISGSTTQTGNNSLYGNNIIIGNNVLTGSNTITGSNYIIGANNLVGNTIISGSFIVSGSGANQLIGNTDITGSLNVIGDMNVVSGSSFYRWGNKLFNYGAFSSTQTQIGLRNSILSMSFNTTDIGGSGVSLLDSTKISVENTGIYNLQFSAQLDRSTSGTNIVTIWFAYTGSSITNSATDVTITGGAAANPLVASWNYILPMSASSYVEIYWSHNDNADDDIELKAVGVRANPTRPAVPSVIATLTQIA